MDADLTNSLFLLMKGYNFSTIQRLNNVLSCVMFKNIGLGLSYEQKTAKKLFLDIFLWNLSLD